MIWPRCWAPSLAPFQYRRQRLGVLDAGPPLGQASIAYLQTLKAKTTVPPFTLAHGSWRSRKVWEYILDHHSADRNFDVLETDYCLVGHSHLPIAFVRFPGESYCLPVQLPVGVPMSLTPRMILNPGSVGQPRDLDPRAAYALLALELCRGNPRRVVTKRPASRADSRGRPPRTSGDPPGGRRVTGTVRLRERLLDRRTSPCGGDPMKRRIAFVSLAVARRPARGVRRRVAVASVVGHSSRRPWGRGPEIAVEPMAADFNVPAPMEAGRTVYSRRTCQPARIGW